MKKRLWAALILVAVGSTASAAGTRGPVERARPARGNSRAARTVKPKKQVTAKPTAADLRLRRWRQAKRHEARGFQFYENRAWTDALSQFRQALRLEPSNSHCYAVMGDIYAASRALPRAVHAYQTALRLSPRDTSLHERLGITYERMDLPHLAASVYKNVIWIDARDSSAHQHLGWALERQGKRPDAILAYQRAIELQPDNSIARARLNRLQPGRPPLAGRVARR